MSYTTKDARFWDRIARKYAADPIADPKGYERTLDRARHYLETGDKVFEFGCGTGTTALRLAPSVAQIVATDVSREMIAIARERLRGDSSSNAVFEVAPPDAPRWPDASFDAVLGFNVLHLLSIPEAALKGVHRLLKPGGLFISKTPCIREMNPLVRMAIPVMQLIGKAPYVSVLSADELQHQVAAAGFEIIEEGRHGSERKDPRLFLVARKRPA